MTHFPVVVFVPTDLDPEEETRRLLAPYDEDGTWFRDEDAERPESKWDWWTIGGRWTGSLTGYDPREDPDNFEACHVCGGTGDRALHRGESRAVQHPSGCNGCEGRGQSMKWRLKPYDGDILAVEAITEFIPHAIVTPDGAWHEHGRMGWWGTERAKESDGDWQMRVLALRQQFAGHLGVLVDCHV